MTIYVCPPLGSINDASVDTCESALFLNKQDTLKLCDTYVLRHFPPNFIKGEGYWTYATSEPMTLTELSSESSQQTSADNKRHGHTYIR